MLKKSRERVQACLLASHPLVLAELARFLTRCDCVVQARRLEHGVDPKGVCAELPQSPVYALDACGSLHHDLTLVRSLLERFPEARVLVLGEVFTATNAIPFLRLGVKGLLSYADTPRRFREALNQVARGRLWVSRDLVSAFVESAIRSPHNPASQGGGDLSRREQEVLQALLDNRSNKEIGDHLHIAERTAKFHVANLLKKVGVKRRSDLIAQWWQGSGKAQ